MNKTVLPSVVDEDEDRGDVKEARYGCAVAGAGEERQVRYAEGANGAWKQPEDQAVVILFTTGSLTCRLPIGVYTRIQPSTRIQER
jgi:hypothetical protein